MGSWKLGRCLYRWIPWLLSELAGLRSKLAGILLSRGEGCGILLRSIIEVRSWPVRVWIRRWLPELRCHGLCHPRSVVQAESRSNTNQALIKAYRLSSLSINVRYIPALCKIPFTITSLASDAPPLPFSSLIACGPHPSVVNPRCLRRDLEAFILRPLLFHHHRISSLTEDPPSTQPAGHKTVRVHSARRRQWHLLHGGGSGGSLRSSHVRK